jgi:predicted HNH restriction endonuclease
MPRKSKYTKEFLEPIVAGSRSIGQVIQKLGLTRTGGTYKNLKYHIQRHDISTKHFLGQGWNKLGQSDFNNGKENIKTYFKQTKERKPDHVKSRLLTYGLKKSICENCGINGNKGWLNKDITIELHHIDGCRSNNNLSNLQMLCPNCHSQTSNYRNRKRKEI